MKAAETMGWVFGARVAFRISIGELGSNAHAGVYLWKYGPDCARGCSPPVCTFFAPVGPNGYPAAAVGCATSTTFVRQRQLPLCI